VADEGPRWTDAESEALGSIVLRSADELPDPGTGRRRPHRFECAQQDQEKDPEDRMLGLMSVAVPWDSPFSIVRHHRQRVPVSICLRSEAE